MRYFEGNDRYYMFYIGYQNVDTARVCMAESNDGIHNWVRSTDNPVISPEKIPGMQMQFTSLRLL